MTALTCRSCDGAGLAEVLDLGSQYLSDFRGDDRRPPRWPLVLMLCQQCGLLQLQTTTPRGLMYHDRYGFRSGVNEAIREDLRDVVDHALRAHPAATSWLDIACNDGTLLSYVPEQVWRVGVDPVAAFEPESRRHADKIVTGYFDPWWFAPGRLGGAYHQFDVITSISMFYDVADPNQFVGDVLKVLAPGGVWVIQQNYALSMLEQVAVDNVCHEHVTYWSLAALEHLLDRHGLEVVDVTLSPVNGGCFRTLVSRRGVRSAAESVRLQRNREATARLHRPQPWRQFTSRALTAFAELRRLVDDINARGERCYAYGASTRGGTLLQAAGLSVRDLPYAVERQPAKVGRRWSALGIPIISEEQARAERPEYMLVSPWFFRDVIVKREAAYLAAGGRLIFPLPALEIVGA